MAYDVYGEALPGRGTFFRVRIYEREAISLVEIYKRAGKLVISVCYWLLDPLKGPTEEFMVVINFWFSR